VHSRIFPAIELGLTSFGDVASKTGETNLPSFCFLFDRNSWARFAKYQLTVWSPVQSSDESSAVRVNPPITSHEEINTHEDSQTFTGAHRGLHRLVGRHDAPASDSSNPAASSLAGKLSTTSNADKKDKHACEGKNSCKGKGGCKSSDNGCKGKNSCKGKGGCATDGSKKS
jgi:hypothetical protein